MMKLSKNDASVGAFLLVALVAGASFLVLKAQSSGFATGTKRFSIKTTDGSNVKEGAPVRMLGIQAGIVERIDMAVEPRKENPDKSQVLITVHFRVEPRYAGIVRTSAQATLIEPPVLGVTYVDLIPGSPEDAEAQNLSELQFYDQDTLTATIEKGVLRVESILRKTEAAIERANTALAAVAKITTDVADGDGFVSRLVKDQQMSGDLKKTIARASIVVDDLSEVTGGLRRREGAVGRILASDEIIRESEALLRKSRESLASLDAVTKRLTESVEQVAKRLDTTGGNVDGLKDVVDNTKKITAELADLAKKINNGQGSVGKLLNDDAVFVEAKGLLKELRETVQDLREQAPINSFIGVVFSAF